MKAYIVDRSILRENARLLLQKAGSAAVYGVVKGNGYGLGLLALSELLWEVGVRRFAVAEPWEAAALRARLPEAEILMLRETRLENELRELMAAGAVLTVGSMATAEQVSVLAPEYTVPYPVHAKLDTGMGRYGFLPGEIDHLAALYGMENLDVQGIYTHFHSAFSSEKATRAQFDLFQGTLRELARRGIDPGLRHCCNSSAFLRFPEMHLDAVRLGSAVLGRLSFPGDFGLRPVGWCEAQVELLRDIPKGQSVGYSATWRAKRKSRIAVTSVGTFHGFDAPTRYYPGTLRECILAILGSVRALLRKRTLTGTLNGRTVPAVGLVGMVQTMFDVTDVPCQVGDVIRLELRPLSFKGLEIEYRN